jgi:hypothetical protein
VCTQSGAAHCAASVVQRDNTIGELQQSLALRLKHVDAFKLQLLVVAHGSICKRCWRCCWAGTAHSRHWTHWHCFYQANVKQDALKVRWGNNGGKAKNGWRVLHGNKRSKDGRASLGGEGALHA